MATDRLRRKLRDTEPNELADLTANFCIIGTPLPELNARNKDANELKPIWQQEARDSQGRRRFHGAFTGGFSAGYYNTVGSKEGWTPGSFRSSRTDKRNGKQPEGGVGNRVEDFMDEEDLEDWKAAQHISTASRFGGSNDDLLAGPRGNIDPLASALFGDIRPSHSGSIGFKILRRMGWKEGQGLGPRVDAKKRARLLSLISSSSDASTFATSSDVTSEDMKYLYAPPPTPLLMLTVTRNGSRRGLGAEDKPTLHQTLAKDYKPSVAVASATSEEVWPDGRPLLSGFRLASHQLPLEPTFTMEPVPEGWRPDPSRVWNLYAPPSDTKPSDLTPSSRGQLLGEAKAPGPPPNIAAFLSAKARERLGVDSNVALPSTPASSRLLPESVDAPRLDVDTAKQALQGFAPFGADPSRQERYRTYLKGQVDAGSEEAHRLPVPQHMTVEQFANELRDFAKSATIFRPVSSAIAGRFTTASAAAMEHETKATSATPGLRQPMPAATLKHQEDDEGGGSGPVKELSVAQKAAQMGNFGHLTRKIEPWVPERLLCKRFGVPEPATSRKWGTEGLESTTTRDKIGGVEIQDDLDPFYGSTRSTKTQSSSARVDQYWERTKEQLKALGAGPMPLSLDAQSSLRPASTASFASEEIVDDTTVGMGEDERQGWDTLKYVKPSLDVYKAIFASDEEASDVEDTTAAKPGSTAKPKMPNPSSGSRVVFQARSKRKDTDADAEKTTHTSAPTKRKEKGSKKLLLTFDMDDDGDTVEVQKKDKRPKKSSSTFDVDGSTAATGTCPMLNRPTNLKKKARIRASDLF